MLNIVARQKDLNFAPGSHYLYSNSNYNLLAIIVARVSGFDDVTVVNAEDVPDVAKPTAGARPELQIAMLAVRLEMAAVYLRLAE